MTAPQAKMFAYHLSIVVYDLDAACERYSELLAVPEWHRSEVERPGVPVNPKTAGGHGILHIAFGRVPGMTFELIQPEGTIEHKVFLDAHGEGVQHIGVWTRMSRRLRERRWPRAAASRTRRSIRTWRRST